MKRFASSLLFKRCFTAGYLIERLKSIGIAFICLIYASCSARTIDVLIGGPQTINTDLRPPEGRVSRTFRPGVAIGDESGALEASLYSQISANLFKRHPAHQGNINDLEVSSDGLRVFSAGDDGRVVLSEAQSLDVNAPITTTVILEGQNPVLALALSKDEHYLAISRTASVLVFDMSARKFSNQLSLVKGRITALSWDPDGEYLTLGRSNGDVFCWKIKGTAGAGRNSSEELEHYLGAKSPIVSIWYHPSGRAFFAAEASGAVSFWRLLRTEQQIGLRDEFAIKDSLQLGREREKIVLGGSVISDNSTADTDLNSTSEDDLEINDTSSDSGFTAGVARVEDMYLSADGNLLAVAADNGVVFPIKVRGLVAQGGLQASNARIRSITGSLVPPESSGALVLAISQRVNRIRFLCADRGALKIVAESELLKNSLGVIRAAEKAPILWVAEKTGNLLRFDMQKLREQEDIVRSLNSCGA